MGNIIDRVINKGPPFAPQCVPDCTPAPNDLRGNTCYKGKCVSLCPVNSTTDEDNMCICIEENATYKDDNSFMNNDPSLGDGWGYCETEEILQEEKDKKIEKELEKELDKNPNMTEKEKKDLKENIKKGFEEEEKKEKEKKAKKQIIKFNPVSLFIDRTPKELDDRVKTIVKAELKKNPNMSDEELTKLISATTINVVEELAVECEDEYKIAKTILSPKYGNGNWPTKQELEVLIDNNKFPWLKSQINQWPEEKSITSCSILTAVKDKITLNNRCIYSDEYPNVVEECNVSCGYGTEVRQKEVVRETNSDFPSIQPCGLDPPTQEFECDSGLICKEDCKLEINMTSFGEARCSKPCDSGDGPGEKTYKVKYVKASQGEPDDMGSCELDEEDKEEGQEYDVTVKCNKDKCPDCEIKRKDPYKDNIVDYTGSIIVDDDTKTYTRCLLTKEDGTFEDMDCGAAEGGHNYVKGARAKYNVSYKITEDEFGVQSCTKGEEVIEEGCPLTAFSPDLVPIVGPDGNMLKGGGEECENNCILSDDYPEVVMVQHSDGGKVECTEECGGGIKRMRRTVKSKRNAKYCPCRDDISNCPYEEIPCNTQDCIAPCVYRDGENTQHVQINDKCPGREGPNKDIVWDVEKVNAAGGEGMWYDSIANKYYERNHFVKKMRVPTKKPPIGKGLCYQGTKADKTEQCPIAGTEKPIDAVWGPWAFTNDYQGLGFTLGSITPFDSKWTHKKINTVKVGSKKIGPPEPGSNHFNWPSGGITKVIYEVKKMGHTLGKTVHYVEKKNNKIFLYKKGSGNTTSGSETWEFQEAEQLNPNFGLEGDDCVDTVKLQYATQENLPGKIYRREVIKHSDHGGKSHHESCDDPVEDPVTKEVACHFTKVIPYMRNDGINTKIRGEPLNNMTEAECLEYGIETGLKLYNGGVAVAYDQPVPVGCWEHDGNIRYNTDTTKSNGIPCGYKLAGKPVKCIEKGPGGEGYIKNCPIGVKFVGANDGWDGVEFTGTTGNMDQCLDTEGKTKKFSVKELEEEAKKKFVRDSSLQHYTAERAGEHRILGPGSRSIYMSKQKDVYAKAEHGGITAGLWHQKKENFRDVSYSNNNTLNNSCGSWTSLIKN